MPEWKVTVIDREDKAHVHQETHVNDEKFKTAKQVEAFAKSNWKHLRFVKAEPVGTHSETSAE